MNPLCKLFIILILTLLTPNYVLAWCSEPMAPTAPSTWNKPTKPTKPMVPFCVNEYSNTHTCDDWTINSYNSDVSSFNSQLQSYNYDVDD